jgi:hypothetical protein
LHNFNQIISYKELNKDNTILLIGNHDYISDIHDENTSGYQRQNAFFIKDLFEKNKDLFQICYKMDKFLFSHAGISHEFMDNSFTPTGWDVEDIDKYVTDLFKHQPYLFKFNGTDPYGDNKYQTPVWIRPGSLMRANRDSPIKKEYIQIVGHTKVNHIDFAGNSTGNRYYFVDTLDTCQEYLTIIDGEIKLNIL